MKTNEKTITINDKAINFSFDIQTWLIYRAAFGTSPEEDLDSLDTTSKFGLMRATLHIYPQIIWALARTADSSIPSIKKWYKQLGPVDCLDVCEELGPLFDNMAVMENV